MVSLMGLGGHVGASVSALIDGQLPPEQEERLWAHIHCCASCRRLVETEGDMKRRLAALSDPGHTHAPLGLQRSLYDVDAWSAVDEIERRSRRRRAAAAVAGAGSVGVAVLGIMGMTTPPVSRHEVPQPAMLRADLMGPGSATGAGAGLGAGLPVLDRRAAR